MRRTSERCTKVRLSFSGGPHAPWWIIIWRMTVVGLFLDPMEGGDGSPKELQGFTKTWRKKTCHIMCYFVPPASTSSILYTIFVGVCDPPKKLILALAPCSYILCMIVKLA